MARESYQKGGLSNQIDFQLEDVRQFMKRQSDEAYDLIFLDAERPEYTSYWSDVDRVLKIVVYTSLMILYLQSRKNW